MCIVVCVGVGFFDIEFMFINCFVIYVVGFSRVEGFLVYFSLDSVDYYGFKICVEVLSFGKLYGYFRLLLVCVNSE